MTRHLLAAFLLLTLSISSCKQNNKATIIGTWVVNNVEITNQGIFPAGVSKKEEIIGSTFTFKADSTLTIANKKLFEPSESGRFSIINEGGHSYLTFPGSPTNPAKWKIAKLTGNSLDVRVDYGIVFTMHLVKH